MAQEPVPLGKPVADDYVGRDAIHVAIFPATCDEELIPGQHVGLPDPEDSSKVSGYAFPHIGLVDPFLRPGKIEPGTRIFVCLYPNTVTGLRHVWTHTAFPPEDGVDAVRERQATKKKVLAQIPGFRKRD